MTTLILIIIAISTLILVHEWGHFYAARLFGVKIEEFGFGFPPKVFSKVKNGIRYSFNLLPLGGFVKIFGEHGEGEGSKESFVSRPAWQRFIILAAGVFMNVVLAWLIFTVGAFVGIPQVADEQPQGIPVSIIAVQPNSPAEKAGLKFGDQLVEMKTPEVSLRIESEKDVREFTQAYRGEEITLLIRRNNEIKEFKATPRIQAPEGEGPLGIALGRLTIHRTPWFLAPIEGARTVWRSTVLTFAGFGSLIKEFVVKGKTSIAVSGPVGIFYIAEDTRSLGVNFFIQFIGVLSVNLAILNFLPIPALDGGRIFFLLIEKIKGKRVNPYLENMAHTIGFVVLILLMALITYHDIARIF